MMRNFCFLWIWRYSPVTFAWVQTRLLCFRSGLIFVGPIFLRDDDRSLPHVQLQTDICFGGLVESFCWVFFRLKACLPAWNGRYRLPQGDICTVQTPSGSFFERWARWTDLISVLEFEGRPWNKSTRTCKVTQTLTRSFQIIIFSSFLEELDDPQMCCQLGQTGPLFIPDQSEFLMTSACMYKHHSNAMNHMLICSQRKTSMRFIFDSRVRLFVYLMPTTFSYYPSLAASQACNSKPEAA